MRPRHTKNVYEEMLLSFCAYTVIRVVSDSQVRSTSEVEGQCFQLVYLYDFS